MNNSKLPLLSICCLGYNHAKFCEKSIRSIWDQDYPNIEIIVIDDGSTDNTYKILCNLAKISPVPMKVLTQKNTYNLGYNHNRGLKEAQGEFVMLTSLDDYYLPNVFGALVNEISADDTLQFVTTEPSAHKVCFDKSAVDYNNMTKQDLLNLEKQAGAFWMHSTIWRKSVIDAVGGFDEDLTGEDIVLRTKVLRYIVDKDYLNCKITTKLKSDQVFCHVLHGENLSFNSARQCKILQEVLDRYFPGEHSEVLDSWMEDMHREERLKKSKIRFYIYRTLKGIYIFLKFFGLEGIMRQIKLVNFIKKLF